MTSLFVSLFKTWNLLIVFDKLSGVAMHKCRFKLFTTLLTVCLLLTLSPKKVHAATSCADLGISIIIDLPDDRPIIRTPVPATITVRGLSEFTNESGYFVRISSALNFCSDINSPALPTTSQSQTIIDNFLINTITKGDDYYACDVALKNSSNDTICEFPDMIVPTARVYANHPPKIGKNQQLSIWGSTNYIGDVCAIKKGVDFRTLACTTPQNDGSFSMLFDHGLDPGTYSIQYNSNSLLALFNEMYSTSITVTDKDQDLPGEGQVGGKCKYMINTRDYRCDEGEPSSQTPNCMCIDSLEPGAVAPSRICEYAGTLRAECEQCMGDISNTGKVWTAIGCISAKPQEFIETLLIFAIGIAGGIAFLMILYGGFSCMMAAGNPEKLNSCKEIITSAIIGLLLVVFSTVILKIIGKDILGGFPGFGG